MAGIMTTKAAKWETTAWAAIRDDMKGVFLQDGDVHRETAWKEQSQMEGRERKWERKKKGRKGERRERERAAVTEPHQPFCNPLPNHRPPLTLCLEALKHESLWEGVERQCFNQIFIQCKASAAPQPTFNHQSLSLPTRIQNQMKKIQQTHSRSTLKRRQSYSRCSFSSWGGRWATRSWTRSLQRWPTLGGCSPSHQPGCTPLPCEKINSLWIKEDFRLQDQKMPHKHYNKKKIKKTRGKILNWILNLTGSQWSYIKTGVIWKKVSSVAS